MMTPKEHAAAAQAAFVRQVEQAVVKMLFDAQGAGAKPLWADSMAAFLGPRIAAAITATAQWPALTEAQQQTALAVLRGEPHG